MTTLVKQKITEAVRASRSQDILVNEIEKIVDEAFINALLSSSNLKEILSAVNLGIRSKR